MLSFCSLIKACKHHSCLLLVALNVFLVPQLFHSVPLLWILPSESLPGDERQLRMFSPPSSYPRLLELISLIGNQVRWLPHPRAESQDSSVLLEQALFFASDPRIAEHLFLHRKFHTRLSWSCNHVHRPTKIIFKKLMQDHSSFCNWFGLKLLDFEVSKQMAAK